MAFDLDKVIAEEQTKEPYEFTFDGVVYRLPPSPDIKPISMLAEGNIVEALPMLLGEEQWERIKASTQVLSATAFLALFNDYAEWAGLDSLGESPASPPSSNRTARRSKLTSKGSTGSGSPRLVKTSPGGDSAS